MSINTNERKNITKGSQKRRLSTSGCWYGKWPKKTDAFKRMDDIDHAYEYSIEERVLPLATGLANYYGEFSKRIGMLTKVLYMDIHHQSQSALDMILRNPDCAREESSDLFEAMYLIGDYNLFYDDGRIKERIIKSSEQIAEKLYLSKEEIGMPVKCFLLYYKGDGCNDGEGGVDGMRRKQIAIMSGIPAEYIEWAYKIVTVCFGKALDDIHMRKKLYRFAQRKKPVEQPEDDGYLPLVDLSKPRQTSKTEEPATEELVADPDPMDMSIDELQAMMDKVLGEIEDASGLEPKTFDQVSFVPVETAAGDFAADDFSE